MTRRSLSAWVLPGIALLLLGLVLGNVALLLSGMFVLITALLAAALPPPSDIVLERSLPRTTVWSGDTLSVDRRLVARRWNRAAFRSRCRPGGGPGGLRQQLAHGVEVAGP